MGSLTFKFSTVLIPFLPIYFNLLNSSKITLYILHEFNSLPLIIWYSGVALAVLSVFGINQRTSFKPTQLYIYVIFLPLVYLFISTTNLLVFFFCYEFFLLPSFLIILFGSPNRRGVIASIYFLMWTQVGSFLVFTAILVSFYTTNSFLLGSISQVGGLAPVLALIGFGIKVPVWPAHYWLTKTHVEAPTYFSIYLSGFLVKTALYGIWIFISNVSQNLQSIFLAVSVIGVIDSSLKMWAQVDLKKLVAYGTVQEMNLILIGFTIGVAHVIKAVSFFILAHTLLSTMFFLQSDSLYRRFGSRSTLVVRGLLQNTPIFGWVLFVSCLLFAGLPFTLKFSVELFIFLQLWEYNTLVLFVVVIVCNWFGLVSFMKNWFTPLFGSSKLSLADLSLRELIIYLINFILLFILTFISVYFI